MVSTAGWRIGRSGSRMENPRKSDSKTIIVNNDYALAA